MRIALLAPCVLLAAAATGTHAPALFDSQTILEAELRGPLRDLLDDETGAARQFELFVNGAAYIVKASAGGNSRQRVCSFPPLELRFEARQLPPDDNSGPDSRAQLVRLVTHCRSGTKAEDNVIEEYLAYRIFNLISGNSYRTRLLRLTYRDTGRDTEPLATYAFAVESEYALARRLDGEVLEIPALPKARLDEEHAALVYVFQYLIGNTDWSLVTAEDGRYCCHNGQLVSVSGKILYIPYDFDITGLVNPPYARPDSSLRIRRVTTRRYRGYCGPVAALRRAILQVVQQRKAILDLYRQAPVLSSAARKRGVRYLEDFFSRAEDPEKLLDDFQDACLGRSLSNAG